MNRIVSSLALGMLLNIGLANAEVSSMSLESFNGSGDVKYWEVSVQCAGDPQERLMRRVVGKGNPWCSSDNTDLCNESKFALSGAICGANTAVAVLKEETQVLDSADDVVQSAQGDESELAAQASQIALDMALDPTKEARRTALLREQVQIEEQRILIEQKRLELMQTELKLKRQVGQ